MLTKTFGIQKTLDARAGESQHRGRFPVGMIIDITRVLDGVLILAAGLVVMSFAAGPSLEAVTPWLLMAGLVLGMWGLDLTRFYEPRMTRAWGSKALRGIAVMVCAAGVLTAFSALTATQAPAVGGPVFVSWFAVAILAVITLHGVLAVAVRTGALHPHFCERVAVVGPERRAAAVAQRLRDEGNGVYDIAGVFHFDGKQDSGERGRVPQGCQDIEQLVAGTAKLGVDHVVLALPWSASHAGHFELLERLKGLAVDVHLVLEPDQYRVSGQRLNLVGDVPLLCLAASPLSGWRGVAKAIEDYVIALAVLPLFIPLYIVIAALIRLESPGPALFRQPRDGFNNVPIEVFKFRTMRHDSCDASGAQQTSRNDPRVTRIGAFLRRTSLDELPQIINVLRGEMSIVGPRPHPLGMRTEEKLCHEIVANYAHRHRMKPGITGWAQIHGWRGAVDTSQELCRRVELDLEYIERWSIVFDLRIIVQTALTFIGHKNAF